MLIEDLAVFEGSDSDWILTRGDAAIIEDFESVVVESDSRWEVLDAICDMILGALAVDEDIVDEVDLCSEVEFAGSGCVDENDSDEELLHLCIIIILGYKQNINYSKKMLRV